MFALERWLFDWEEARRPTSAPEPGGHADWFEPPECTLLLLPTALSEEVPAVTRRIWRLLAQGAR